MTKPLCPILTIGFEPPKGSQHDLRRCTNECAWYDKDNDCCAVISLLESSTGINSMVAEIESFLFDQEVAGVLDDDYEYDPTTDLD